MTLDDCRVAILYQALPPATIAGLRKAAKPGGYSDGGADIAVALRSRGVEVVTPVASPASHVALDWVFPDTAEGIEAAGDAGAQTLWANTVLFQGHPLESVLDRFSIVGQRPAKMQAHDDKFATNHVLAGAGLPVARSVLVGPKPAGGILPLSDIGRVVDHLPVFPLVVKPVRGRGSQGVTRVDGMAALSAAADRLIGSGTFGDMLMIEEYLGGEEMTVTVMPPGSTRPDGSRANAYRALRPVRRYDQRDGVAPYNGDVPVSANSVALDGERLDEPAIAAMIADCEAAADVVEARAAIRIDCRADARGTFRLFDLNMKPNMTGPGRPGRTDQGSLSAIAAQADGMSYPDLVCAMLAGRW